MKNLIIVAAIFLLTFTLSFAQSTETKAKLKDLKGEVTKITVETTEGKVELTGDDAEAVFKKLKSSKKNNLVFIHKDMDDDLEKEITIDVDVEDNDGEKVVIIKKNVDGKESIKKYKGEEAEKFMNKHSEKQCLKFISEDGCARVIIDSKMDNLHWISENGEKTMIKNFNVEIQDGVKKITFTTNEDGKEKVHVYEGEDAEKFLEEMEGSKIEVLINKDGNKTIIKKKIIIEDEDDDDENEDK